MNSGREGERKRGRKGEREGGREGGRRRENIYIRVFVNHASLSTSVGTVVCT